MATNFFTNLASISESALWHITVNVDKGTLVVSTMFNSDNDNALPAVIFRGTTYELDNGYFSGLSQPVDQIKELFANRIAHQNSVENAKKSAQNTSKQDVSTPTSTAPKVDDTAERKRKYEETIKKIEQLNAVCKYTEALEILPSKAEHPDKVADLDKLHKELTWKSKQLSLL